MSNITITNEQAEIIGREIGKAFAEVFWDRVQASNRDAMTKTPGNHFIDRLGGAIGRTMALMEKGK
jgi:hypothetical protein